MNQYDLDKMSFYTLLYRKETINTISIFEILLHKRRLSF